MGLLVLSYPELKPENVNWIQIIRFRLDPHYELVNPHFTLILEVSAVARDNFIDHVRRICEGASTCDFRLRFSTVTHV